MIKEEGVVLEEEDAGKKRRREAAWEHAEGNS